MCSSAVDTKTNRRVAIKKIGETISIGSPCKKNIQGIKIVKAYATRKCDRSFGRFLPTQRHQPGKILFVLYFNMDITYSFALIRKTD